MSLDGYGRWNNLGGNCETGDIQDRVNGSDVPYRCWSPTWSVPKDTSNSNGRGNYFPTMYQNKRDSCTQYQGCHGKILNAIKICTYIEISLNRPPRQPGPQVLRVSSLLVSGTVYLWLPALMTTVALRWFLEKKKQDRYIRQVLFHIF